MSSLFILIILVGGRRWKQNVSQKKGDFKANSHSNRDKVHPDKHTADSQLPKLYPAWDGTMSLQPQHLGKLRHEGWCEFKVSLCNKVSTRDTQQDPVAESQKEGA